MKDLEQLWSLYTPSKGWDKLQALRRLERRQTEDAAALADATSVLHQKIRQGLQRKRTPEEAARTFEDIRANKEVQLEQLRRDVAALEVELAQDPRVVRYEALKVRLDPLLERWTKVDQDIGNENVMKGQELEAVLRSAEVLGVVANRLQLQGEAARSLRAHTNVPWLGIPGEIDLVVTLADATRAPLRSIACIVESKCRLFDVASAFRQSGTQRRHAKSQIELDGVVYDVTTTTPVFVFTTVPNHAYNLGFESDLKDDLFKLTIKQKLTDRDLIGQELRKKYCAYQSPQDWFAKYAREYLIVNPH